MQVTGPCQSRCVMVDPKRGFCGESPARSLHRDYQVFTMVTRCPSKQVIAPPHVPMVDGLPISVFQVALNVHKHPVHGRRRLSDL